METRHVSHGGIAAPELRACELRSRQGGERFQRQPNAPPRSLKKQFQSAGVAAWEREAPLVYAGGELVYVAGLGIDARRTAAPGTPQLALRWLPDAAGKP
jgi:tRNA(Ile)-lysidine synthase